MGRSKAVAIKSPHDAIEEDEPANTGELLCEAQFLEACGSHPSIVSFHSIVGGDYVTDELSLIMEYVRGQRLCTRGMERRPISSVSSGPLPPPSPSTPVHGQTCTDSGLPPACTPARRSCLLQIYHCRDHMSFSQQDPLQNLPEVPECWVSSSCGL
jgi:hypothetical protein